MRDRNETSFASVKPGEQVYDGDGTLLGRVRTVTEDTFEIERSDGADDAEGGDEEELPGPDFGEGYIMWRCEECGEMGELEEGIPDPCPNCGAPEEALSAWKED